MMGISPEALPVGMTVSKISLLAIGVNMPSSTTTNAQMTSIAAFGPETTLQVKRMRSFTVSDLKGSALVKVMALG